MLAIGKRTEPKPDLNFQPAWKSFDPVLHFPANISLSNKPNRGYSCILSLSQTDTNRLCCRPKQLPCYSSGISRMQCQRQHTLPFSSSHLLGTNPVPAVAGQLLIQESRTRGWTAPAPAYTLPPDLPARKQHTGVLWHSPCTRCQALPLQKLPAVPEEGHLGMLAFHFNANNTGNLNSRLPAFLCTSISHSLQARVQMQFTTFYYYLPLWPIFPHVPFNVLLLRAHLLEVVELALLRAGRTPSPSDFMLTACRLPGFSYNNLKGWLWPKL